MSNIIKNIGDEPFAIGGCPLLQKGDQAEVDGYVVEMVRNNPNIKILEESLQGIEPEPTKKTNSSSKADSSLRGVE